MSKTVPQGNSETQIPKDLIINIRPPRRVPLPEESLEFHATRLLLLVKYAGGRKSRIVGRTKIAKLDFFVRYPVYLEKAARIKGRPIPEQMALRPESPMIRYKYGPWDPRYYNVFALLVGKGLLDIFPSKDGDVFQLTSKGEYAIEELLRNEFDLIVERCNLVCSLFGKETGTGIKKFIYKHFPEIVAKDLGEEIRNE